MLRLALDGLRFHWRLHTGVLVGTALAAAVLTGALLVGDSVDYSLRHYALARLGGIHFALEARGRPFSQALAGRIGDQIAAPVAPVLALPGMAVALDEAGGRGRQVNRVNVIGHTAAFWAFDPAARVELGDYEVALNARLAEALGVAPGDRVAIRVSKPGLLPRDAPLSARVAAPTSRALCTVRAVLPDSGLGRFGLSAVQTAPYNAFVDLAWLQEQADLAGLANQILVGDGVAQDGLDRALADAWRPDDVGIRLREPPGGPLLLESDRVYLRAAVADAALSVPGAQGTLAYLVNSISKDGRSTPYSFAVAGPVSADMDDDQVVINQWLADWLDAKPGDAVRVAYYELGPANDFIEGERTFLVHSIATMAGLALEKELMPEFPGLSDVERCQD
ncbi:MAG: hypothetical protein JXR94_02855, partial [Candidatus Hydrogenedentes bacterium]|nr:hypothetical protein [Candidatus Hydrogenedentota bacterium]